VDDGPSSAASFGAAFVTTKVEAGLSAPFFCRLRNQWGPQSIKRKLLAVTKPGIDAVQYR